MASLLESRRQAWDVIFNDANLSAASLRQRGITGNVCQQGLRSVCWKIFLDYLPTLEVSTWPALKSKERQRYSDLRHQYIDEPTKKMMNAEADGDLTDNNPLALNESNPWQQYFEDSEIRKVIRQDVERTFPDVEFFRADDVQEQMTDILFVYCKMNQDVSYRQGMHELLAPFYWTVATDSLRGLSEESPVVGPTSPATKLMMQVLDGSYVEHDAFILFEKLMTYAKPWYEFNDSAPVSRNQNKKTRPVSLGDHIPKKSETTRMNPMVLACHRIHHEYLRTIDPPLYKHLESLNIEPQLYGIRWLRLLFGREFEFKKLLTLWDAIFAQDPTLQNVEYVCLAMLLRLRDQLINKDYSECLTTLMRCPELKNPPTLVEQAKYLQDNLSEEGALQILRQNDIRAGKEPRSSLMDGVEVATPSHLEPRTASPGRLLHRRSYNANLDGFANLTRGVMKNPQVRDLNKAIAGVMDTVQKNVNLLGDNVLGRAYSDSSDTLTRRRSTVGSEFPSGVDRLAYRPPIHIRRPADQVVAASSSRTGTEDDELAKVKSVNRQMGQVVAQCVDLLEKELFPSPATSSKASDTSDPEEQQGHSVSESSPSPEETEKHEGQENTENAQTKSIEKSEDHPASGTKPNEASIILALANLKHVRDVLLGKQAHFDADIMGVPLKTQPAQPLTEWDFVHHNEVEGKEPSPPPPPPAVQYEKSTPVSPVVSDKPEVKAPVSVKYIPANPTPPKSQVRYSMDDLLSDPKLQSSGTKASQRAKFHWMLEDNDESTSPASKDRRSSSSTNLFKLDTETTRPIARKRSSFIHHRPTEVISPSASPNQSTIDPLDAKNVDKRRVYEHDIF
ncbi:rab-GTPase-TBC domain-containing protein [Radiomyces spectabilis]|uniref:rab-GTPase-TBC domain-containing protein n=1 Tax=Radiomyces spectabilis TaxID=64574 RepID=UPI00221FFF89|nr:rab-GTPase-TBC domain-containing protein [Radiomyces spectabilis]KAI8367560.1 rab-GTPase-TBC domain-containing protein [Radiomyces spectabilis]